MVCMNRRRGLLAGLLAPAVRLTGCVWLRLLELKNQLAEFDRYVRVDDQRGLAFEFVKPVLYAKGVRARLELDPTSAATNGHRVTGSWTFEKVPPTHGPPENFDLTFETGFTGLKLSPLGVPERFLALVPREMIIGPFRAFGQAEVNQKQRSASATLRDEARADATNRLSQTQLLAMPGPPLATEG